MTRESMARDAKIYEYRDRLNRNRSGRSADMREDPCNRGDSFVPQSYHPRALLLGTKTR